MNKVLEKADLFFKEGSSDKVYHATIEKADSGFVVNYAYGRRGNTLKTGTKTASPLSEAKAREVFDKLVREKTGKGYQYISSAQNVLSSIPTVNSSKTPVHQCVLLNAIDRELAVELVQMHNCFLMQPKMDGVRFLLSLSYNHSNPVVEGFNRKGIPTPVPQEISESIFCSNSYYNEGVGPFLIDGELIGDKYYVFDILEYGVNLRDKTLDVRMTHLNELMETIESDNVICIETYIKPSDKIKAFTELEKNAEGVVFKNINAKYTPGRPASGGNYLKHKFYETGSFIVNTINNKRSVELKVADTFRVVGNVTIPSNFDVPKVGSVVEVRYLYAYRNGSLYQPVYLGERTDIDESECTEDQLKYKQ